MYLRIVSALSGQAEQAETSEEKRRLFRSYSDMVPAETPAGLSRKNWYLACEGREIPLRIYRPDKKGPLPTIVFFHGGGWELGDLETHDALVTELTNTIGAQVISVHYRRAPENRHPAAIEDGYEVYNWVIENAASIGADPEHIAVSGDSSGGFIAASLCHMIQRLGGKMPCLQLLIYPAIAPDFSTKSYLDNAEAPLLSRADMQRFWQNYLPMAVSNTLKDMPADSDDLSNMPPAHIVAAEYDPLLDDAVIYAKRLADAGVDTTLTVVPGMLHGFFRACKFSPPAQIAFSDVCYAAKKILFSRPTAP